MMDSNNNTKDTIYVPLLKEVMDAFIQYYIKQCEINNDTNMVVYSTMNSNMKDKDYSFATIIRQAGVYFASQSQNSRIDGKLHERGMMFHNMKGIYHIY